MATKFLQSFSSDGYIITSAVSSIKASTDKTCIDVSLSCENGLDGNIETFYSTSLYAFNGIVELTEVGSLVEEYFRMRGKIADTINIVFDSISLDVHFLYCEYIMPESFDVGNSFFIASNVQRVHQDSIVAIAAVDRGSSTPFIVKAVGHTLDATDELDMVQLNMPDGLNTSGVAYFSVGQIINQALEYRPDPDADPVLSDVLYFSIEYYGIQKMCYIVPAPAYLTFSFRNIFNVTEYLDVVGTITTKTEVSRETAVSNGHSIPYDRNIERSYQIQTEPLTNEEVRIFEQFLASHYAALSIDDFEWEIIISDHTCEPSSDDESLTTISFTWRFAEQRPHIFETTLADGHMPSRRKIFDDTYSPEYE